MMKGSFLTAAILSGLTFATLTVTALTVTTINKVTITQPATSAVLTIANGKTLTASNSLTLTGTDGSSVAVGTGGTAVMQGGALGTPSSGVGTNLTGIPVSSAFTGISKGGLITGTGTNTTAALAVGADGTVPRANSNSTSGLDWFAAGWGQPTGYVSGRYYGPGNYASMSTSAVGSNTFQFVPVFVYKRQAFTAIGYNCTANGSSANAHFGVYKADGTGGIPSTLVTGTDVTVATVGVAIADATFSSAVTLDPGWYYIAVLSSASGLTFTGGSSGGVTAMTNGVGTIAASAAGQNIRLGGSQAYGALPGTAPAMTYTEGTANAWFGLKAQ